MEGLVVFIHDIVDSSACGILQHHDVFTWPRQSDLTLVSTKTLCACAPVSSLCDVTHSMTGAAVLTWWHVTAFVVTGLIRAALARNTLKKKYYSWWVLKQRNDDGREFMRTCAISDSMAIVQRPPYWCSKTMKRMPFWCFQQILWKLNSFLSFSSFKWMCIYAGHVSKNALLANWRYSSSRDQLKVFSVQNGFIFLKNFLAEQLPVFVWD